jgi:threonine dehydrogenase-like Zn-dependent dehydrogenase
MKEVLAAVTVGLERVELRRFPLPDVGDDDALLSIEAAGVCGSDFPFYAGLRSGPPRVQGHENVGRILAIGKEAARRWNVGVGSRVAVEEFIPCWSCPMCRTGNYRLCDRSDPLSTHDALRYGDTGIDVAPALWGGYAEVQYLHPNSLVYPIAEHVPPEAGPLFIPISNGIRWVREVGQLPPGGSVVVIGPGQHGLGCVIGARESGASLIIVLGLARDKRRLDVARALGADATIVADREDAAARVRALTGGEMADLVVDVTPGTTKPLHLAATLARKLGTVILAGGKHEPLDDFDTMEIYRKELTLRGVRGHDVRSVVPAIKLIESGKYDLEPLMTHRYMLNEVQRALETIGGRGDADAIHLTVLPVTA